MKSSTKFYVLFLLIIPFIAWAGSYWYATSIEKIHLNFPKDEIVKNVDNVNDIDAIRGFFKSQLETNQKTFEREVSAYYSYAEVLLSFAIFNASILFLLYRSIVQKGSNKSSNLTGEKDSPSS